MTDTDRSEMGTSDFVRQLKKTFQSLPEDMEIFLFSHEKEENIFSNSAREVVRAFMELTDKLKFREYGLDSDQAQKYDIDRSPSLVIAPGKYNIRWLGAPMGEEGRTFLETLLLVGMGKSQLTEQAISVLKKIDTPRKVRVFISPTCPYCPQEAINAVRTAIEMPAFVSVELVDIQANPDIAEKYSAQSVPQSYANDVLIGRGARSEELFCLSLQKMEPVTLFIPDNDAELVETDLVIVGGGPAGLTAGIYAERSGLKAVVVEKGALGGQVATTPVVENYPGFTQVGGKTLVDVLVSHALEYVAIFQGEEVLSIDPGTPLQVRTSRRMFHAKAVLIATGAQHRLLGVPGEKRLSGSGVSYCATCDGPLFKDRRVLIVGGGNSAVTEALHLKSMGVSVSLVHRRDGLRAQEYLEKMLSESGIPVLWNTEIKEIRGKKRVSSVLLENNKNGEQKEMDIDGIFISIGYMPSVGLAEMLGIELTSEGYIRHDGNHRTSVPGIYSAGDVEGGYKQIVTATGQGAAASLAIFEDMIHPYWLEKKS
jgi:thioredoxin reductase (NADPH)